MKRPGLFFSVRLKVVVATTLMTGLGLADTPEHQISPQLACPTLLMEAECRDYLAQMQAASTPVLREGVQKRYAPLLRERAHLCRAATGDGAMEVIITPKMMSLPTQGKRTDL